MFNTAFCPDAHHLAEEMNGQTINWMQEIANKKNSAIAGTLMIRENNNIYNRLIWISKNGKISKYDKRHLFSIAKEQKFLSKGNKRLIIELNGWKICPLICYDLRFPVFSRNNINYDVLIYLANWPNKRIDAWKTLLKARSLENQCYTIGLNRVGKDGNKIHFSGHSVVYDVVGKELGTIELPVGATIGAIIRKNKAKIAHDDVKLREDDHVILFLTDKNLLNQVQQIFSPS